MNLLDAGIAARLLLGLASTLALLNAAGVAARALVRWDPLSASESQLALERRGHLASALVAVALVAQLGSFALTLLLADRLTGSIRGAMCAWGVLSSADGGFVALGVSCAAAVASVVWLAVDRVDAGAAGLSVLRSKLAWTIPLAGLVAIDLACTARFFLALDFEAIASCCSVTLDAGTATGAFGLGGGPRTVAAGAAALLGLGAAVASFALARRGGLVRAVLAGGLSLAAVGPAVLAVAGWVAPHVYGTPSHLCPFCLLLAQNGGIGWALALTLFLGVSLGLASSVAEVLARRPGALASAGRVRARAGRAAAVAWLAFLALAVAPAVSWALRTGGASLFA